MNGSSYRRLQKLRRASYEASQRSELRMQQSTPPRNTSTMRISQLSLGDGTKRCFRPLQTGVALPSYLKLPPKFNTLDEITSSSFKRSVRFVTKFALALLVCALCG